MTQAASLPSPPGRRLSRVDLVRVRDGLRPALDAVRAWSRWVSPVGWIGAALAVLALATIPLAARSAAQPAYDRVSSMTGAQPFRRAAVQVAAPPARSSVVIR